MFEELAPAEAARGVDVVLLGLPHKVTAAKVPELVAVPGAADRRHVRRLPAARRAGVRAVLRHGPPAPRAPRRVRLRPARAQPRRDPRAPGYVASPGCFATTIELALLPLARAGLLEGVVHVQGITGSSGSGVAPSAGTHHPVRAGNLRTYKPLEHQHVPEIEQTLVAAGARELALRFVPVSAPAHAAASSRPRSSSSPRRGRRSGSSALYREAYAGEPFVRVPAQAPPRGRRGLGLELRRGRGRRRPGPRTASAPSPCFAALDNLVKGGAGQAIQNMNLMLGLDETASLEDPGPWPP